jgi:hypothetical protein
MAVLGALFCVLGVVGAGAAVFGAFTRPRPLDWVCALAAPLLLGCALLGALLLFVPGFFGS